MTTSPPKVAGNTGLLSACHNRFDQAKGIPLTPVQVARAALPATGTAQTDRGGISPNGGRAGRPVKPGVHLPQERRARRRGITAPSNLRGSQRGSAGYGQVSRPQQGNWTPIRVALGGVQLTPSTFEFPHAGPASGTAKQVGRNPGHHLLPLIASHAAAWIPAPRNTNHQGVAA